MKIMRTGRKPGLTLVELVIAVSIVILIATVSLPLLFPIIAQRRVTAALERIANDLRYTQSLAVTEGTVHRLHSGIDGAVNRPGEYRLERDNGAGGWTQVTAWYNPTTDYDGSVLQTVTDRFGTPIATFDVRFNSQGALANGVGVNYPIRFTVVGQNGTTRSVEVLRSGVVRIL
jgi:Tfp pilus assembly protein FimT